MWTRNNAAGIWDCHVELPHSMVGSPAAVAAVGAAAAMSNTAAAAAAPAAVANGKGAGGGPASKRPPLHPGAKAAAGPSPAVAVGSPKGIPRLRSVQAIPQQEEIEKQQPGVTAQADDARLLGSPAFQADAAGAGGVAAAAVAAAQADDGTLWRTLLEEQLRCLLACLLACLAACLLGCLAACCLPCFRGAGCMGYGAGCGRGWRVPGGCPLGSGCPPAAALLATPLHCLPLLPVSPRTHTPPQPFRRCSRLALLDVQVPQIPSYLPTHPPSTHMRAHITATWHCRCGLALVDVEIPLVALADGVHSRSFSGGCGSVGG